MVCHDFQAIFTSQSESLNYKTALGSTKLSQQSSLCELYCDPASGKADALLPLCSLIPD